MHPRHLRTLSIGSGILAAALCGCGDDGGGVDAGPGEIIDAAPRIDVMNGVVCPGAEANYSGTLLTTGAQDDGANLTFGGDLNAGSPPDRLQLQIASNATMAVGTFTLPMTEWAVSICVDAATATCDNALVAYSGTLRVESAETRLKANLDRVIFVDDLTTPTCSVSVTQSSFDVAIDAPF